MTDDPVSRRAALRVSGLALVTGFAGCGNDTADGSGGTPSPTETSSDGSADPDSPNGSTETAAGDETGASETDEVEDEGDDAVWATRVASGFTSPVGVEIPQPGRRFVVDQVGQVYLQDSDGLHDEPFLDVSDQIVDLRRGFDERGLLGLAFHPAFSDNGRFFVRYSAPPRSGTPSDYDHTFVLSEFQADPDASRADPDFERTILEIPEPQFNHNAGDVTFGPDGYLYVAVGDGGASNDQGQGHVEDWYDTVDGGNGQDVTENLLGSILRIDVDSEPSETARNEGGGTADEAGDRNYAIPDDNPLVGEDGLAEHFAWGFRNPWRMSFGPDGRLFVGDVGQDDREEVNIVENGGNYGWNVKEGTHCFQADECPSETPNGGPLIDPIIEYPQGGQDVSGVSVICGYLYDGDDMPAFDGQFIFADWRADGQLYAARERDDGQWPARVISVNSEEQFGPNVLSFGRNPDGEIFVCTTAESGVQGESGAVFRLSGSE